MQFHQLSIAFNQHQVTVRSNAPEVIDGLQQCFAAMITRESDAVASLLGVYRKGYEYHLTLTGDRGCISKPSLDEILGYVEHEIAVQLIRAHPDFLWLHAGAAMKDGQALVFLGDWGSGKSTLVAALYDLGWKFLSDDIVPVNLDDRQVYPFPRLPRVRKNPGKALPMVEVQQLPKNQIKLDPEMICRSPVLMSAIIFPGFDPDIEPFVKTVSPGLAALRLVQGCINFSSLKGFAVHSIVQLLMRVPAYQLSYQDGPSAAELVSSEVFIQSAKAKKIIEKHNE